MRFMQNIVRIGSDLMGWIALLFMAFLMLAITVDVTVRAITGRPISGVFELAEIAMALLVFLGLGWTQCDDAHIRVTALTQLARPTARRLLDAVALVFGALLLGLLALPATEDAWSSFLIREFRWGHLQIPIWWAKILLAFALWFATLQMALAALHRLLGQPEDDTAPTSVLEHSSHG